jgi:Ran GTPase-activating protein (RanGAP) involved in mRNA processing and transport
LKKIDFFPQNIGTMSMLLSTTSLIRPAAPQWLEDTCQRLVENDSSLKTVDLSHPRINDVFAKIFAEALDENNTVTALILSCYNIVDDGTYAIASVVGQKKSIQKLQLRDLRNPREVITFFQSLLQNTTIEELSLRHCQICPQGAQAIAKLLKVHPRLQEVRLVDSQLIGDSLGPICQGLKMNRSIQRLYLVNNEIRADQAGHLADLLQGSSCLRELYLCENELGDEGVKTLTDGVLGSTSLHTLDLRSNDITPNSALSLQGMVVSSQFLVKLNLGSNELGNLGATALARGLQHPSCVLQKLDLSENGIDKAGTFALASMLRTNRDLEELNLGFNAVGDEGATAISCSLERNSTLRSLSLRRNGISNVGAVAFANKLPKMNGLKELILVKNSIDHAGAAALLQGLRFNVELEYLHVEEKVSEPISQEMFHWIRLNKAGRRIFRQANSVPGSLWPRVYGRISADVNVLFHFLSEKPEVLARESKKKRKVILSGTAA